MRIIGTAFYALQCRRGRRPELAMGGAAQLEQAPLIPAQAGIQGQELGPRFRGDERDNSIQLGMR